MGECSKRLIINSTVEGRRDAAFSFDHRSARIAGKRLTFTATTVGRVLLPQCSCNLPQLLGIRPELLSQPSDDEHWVQVLMRIRFNREAAGNFSLGFCDSITSENLTVDRSRSRVCGKGIAMEPISGIVYHTGTPVMGSMARPVPIEDPGGSSMDVGLCMSLATGDVIFLRRVSGTAVSWEGSVPIQSTSFTGNNSICVSALHATGRC